MSRLRGKAQRSPTPSTLEPREEAPASGSAAPIPHPGWRERLCPSPLVHCHQRCPSLRSPGSMCSILTRSQTRGGQTHGSARGRVCLPHPRRLQARATVQPRGEHPHPGTAAQDGCTDRGRGFACTRVRASGECRCLRPRHASPPPDRPRAQRGPPLHHWFPQRGSDVRSRRWSEARDETPLLGHPGSRRSARAPSPCGRPRGSPLPRAGVDH